MSETRGRQSLTVAGLLADPATSHALKTVLVAWARRDPVDAANDAEILAIALARRAEERMSCPC